MFGVWSTRDGNVMNPVFLTIFICCSGVKLSLSRKTLCLGFISEVLLFCEFQSLSIKLKLPFSFEGGVGCGPNSA